MHTPSAGGESLPKPWERNPNTATDHSDTPSSSRQPARPWESNGGTQTANGAISNTSLSRPSLYGGAYGSGMYGSTGAMYGSGGMYGGGMYGSGMYGSGMYGSGMYGGSMYSPGYGAGGMYGRNYMYNPGYGGGMHGSHPVDPNAPVPPSAWQAMISSIGNVVHFFGRLSFLVDENAHAVHFFISALLQLLDRFGSLYGELARFILRLLGFGSRHKQATAEVKTPIQQKSWDTTWSDTQ